MTYLKEHKNFSNFPKEMQIDKIPEIYFKKWF
jgi:hypothetical protein